jgi:hyperosmotically inducible protein
MKHAPGLTTIAVLVLLVGALAGCQAITGKTAGETIDDASITASVKTKLAAEKAGTLTKVDVDTNRGVVYLSGNVDDPALKSRASEIAREVEGVRDVVNNIQVARAQ